MNGCVGGSGVEIQASVEDFVESFLEGCVQESRGNYGALSPLPSNMRN